MITSLICFSIAVCCYAVHELCVHGKIIFESNNPDGFWGSNSYQRKYKAHPFVFGKSLTAPDNWYYKLIGVKYKERWPTSTWLTVAFTDAPHMLQFFYSKLWIAAIILYVPMFSWWVDGLLYLGVWYACFNITYKIFGK